jgi:glycosyltransferase involved in cell wall biosynthesis
VLLIHDVYPEVFIATGMLRPDSLPVRLLHRWVSRLYRSVARVVTLGRDMTELAKQKLPPGDDRVTIIPNWSDCDQVPPAAGDKSNRIRREYGLTEHFVVQYAGNMGRTHNLEAVIECARALPQQAGTPSIHFLLVGSGARKEWLRRTVANEKLDHVTVADRRPRADLPELLTAADVALISFIPGMAGVSVPSRLYNVLAAGCPVIAVCEPHSELALTVREEDVGWVVRPGDAAGFRHAVLDAQSDPQRLIEMGRRARRAAETRFRYERIAEAYRDVMRRLDDPIPRDAAAGEHTATRRAA